MAPLRIRDILRVDAKCPARPAAAFSLGRLHIGDQYKRRGVNLRGPSNIWNRARLFDQPIEADAFVVSVKPSDLFPRIRMLISSDHFCSGHRLRCILKFASKL